MLLVPSASRSAVTNVSSSACGGFGGGGQGEGEACLGGARLRASATRPCKRDRWDAETQRAAARRKHGVRKDTARDANRQRKCTQIVTERVGRGRSKAGGGSTFGNLHWLSSTASTPRPRGGSASIASRQALLSVHSTCRGRAGPEGRGADEGWEGGAVRSAPPVAGGTPPCAAAAQDL